MLWSNWNALEKHYHHQQSRRHYIACPLTETERPPSPAARQLYTALLAGDLPQVQHVVHQGGAKTEYLCYHSDNLHLPPFRTPLFVALWLQHDDIAAFLLQTENAKQPRRGIMREFAIACGEASISLSQLRTVVQYFGKNLHVGHANNATAAGLTPLHYACFQGHWPLTKYLMQQGADWHARATEQALTPLHVLQYNPQRPDDLGNCVAWLLNHHHHHHHQHRDKNTVRSLLLLTDKDGRTVLQHVLQQANADTRNYCIVHMVQRIRHEKRVP